MESSASWFLARLTFARWFDSVGTEKVSSGLPGETRKQWYRKWVHATWDHEASAFIPLIIKFHHDVIKFHVPYRTKTPLKSASIDDFCRPHNNFPFWYCKICEHLRPNFISETRVFCNLFFRKHWSFESTWLSSFRRYCLCLHTNTKTTDQRLTQDAKIINTPKNTKKATDDGRR